MNLSSALEYSSRPPVSVCGTGRTSRFSRQSIPWIVASAGASAYYPPLCAGFNVQFRLHAPGPRLRRFRRCAGTEILIRCPSASPFGYRVRSRLTPGRLAWPGKPWSFGVRVSRPHYRYLCLHFRFCTLQHTSQCTFSAEQNAPLPIFRCHSFGNVLMPDHYPCGTARPVSCYALFK